MELIAALLHSPEVLFLDEPTIGLDVVAQHNIQTFLRHYQQARQITILLTSHYMKDVAALCRRVVIIAQGRIIYDGSLAGIIDRFGGHKVISLLVRRRPACPTTWRRYGEVASERSRPGSSSASIAQRGRRGARPRSSRSHTVEDVSVEDPPLEEVIAEMFSLANDRAKRRSRSPQQQLTRYSTAGEGGTASGRVETPTTEAVLRSSHVCIDPMPPSLTPRFAVARATPGGPSCGSARRAAGLPGRFRAGHADAVPADRHADLPLGGRLRGRSAAAAAARRRSPATPIDDLIAYYLLTMISRAFSSMPGLASGIARDIRDGDDQEVPDPADRHARLPAALPHGPQAGLLRRGGRCRSRWCSTSAAATFPAGPTPTDDGWPSWPRW